MWVNRRKTDESLQAQASNMLLVMENRSFLSDYFYFLVSGVNQVISTQQGEGEEGYLRFEREMTVK